MRLFSLLSMLVIAVIAGLAGVYFRQLAMEDLLHLIERDNADRAEGYLNNVWNQYRETVVPLAASDPGRLASEPEVQRFAQDTIGFFHYLPLVRVNIYSAQGMLLMSTHIDKQTLLASENASPDATYVAAQRIKGTMQSRLLQEVELKGGGKAALVQTVAPLMQPGARSPEATLEILYDLSGPWSKQIAFQLYGTGGVIALFLAFMAVVFLSSKKAENILARQHEANLELAATAAAAQAENREKSQFLANVSHELRTPLNAVIGFSEIIKNEVIATLENKKYHDYIADIHSSGVHLLSLINDILEYSKAEAGKLEMEVSEVNAIKLIQNTVRLMGPRADAARVKVIEVLPKEQFVMVTDNKKFKQILLNLLSNAIKFTPAGGEVRVSAWRDIADDSYGFEVRDTGIGIAPKDISRAMAPFGQVDSALSRKYEGTGLGLPLTKKFVEIMGGKFSIESVVGSGTTITFTLPREIKEREGLIIKQVA